MKMLAQDVPKAKSSKLRETDRILESRGIVRRAGECKPMRQSGGTQYSNPPVVSLTQPAGSGRALKAGRIVSQGAMWTEGDGDVSDTWLVL